MDKTKLQEIADIIKVIVEESCGIKRSELHKNVNTACEILGRPKVSEDTALVAAELLVKGGLLIEIGYNVPNITSIRKSFFLPNSATKIEICNLPESITKVSSQMELTFDGINDNVLEVNVENDHEILDSAESLNRQIILLVATGIISNLTQ